MSSELCAACSVTAMMLFCSYAVLCAVCMQLDAGRALLCATGMLLCSGVLGGVCGTSLLCDMLHGCAVPSFAMRACALSSSVRSCTV